MRRTIGAALGALALRGAAEGAYAIYFCRPHQAFEAAQARGRALVLDRGERVARPGDLIYTCETDHRAGPLVLHRDLDCYCAPARLSQLDIDTRVHGTCRVDQPAPSPLDVTGACQHARCAHHVDE